MSDSLNSMEGVDETEVFELNPDGSLHQYMVHLPGASSSFRCHCGCNVFHKLVGQPDLFICNSCDERYESA